MSSYRGRLASLVRFDLSKADWPDALRAAVVVTIVTAIPIVNGDWTLAIPLHIGAVFVAVSEAGQPFGQRWRTMLWTTAALMAAAFVGHAVSDWAIVAIALTAPVAFACGAIGSKSARGALGGMFTLVTFTIYIGMPVPVQDAGATVLLIGLGGFAQTVAAVAMGIARGQHRGPWTIERWASGWDRAFVIHGVRLAIVMVIATAISEAASLPHPYWLPMTVAFMCKPDRDGTVDRVIHRLAGTCVGLAIMWAFDVALSPSAGVFLFVSLLGATIFVAFSRVNYAVAVTGVTIWIVGVLGAVGDPVASTMGLRLLATAMAAALVLAAFFVPSRLTQQSTRGVAGA